MARAPKAENKITAEKTIVTQQVVTKVEVIVVKIEMSVEDAQNIMRICNNIGGNPGGPRGSSDRLSYALMRAGITPNHKMEVRGGMSLAGEAV